MTTVQNQSWRSIRSEVVRRIADRDWLPGQLIPGEVELAREFGCARTTVNRALRELASAGLLDRRRKAGTRVSLNPVLKATLDIPVTRLEVEQRGAVYDHHLLERVVAVPPQQVAGRLGLTTTSRMLHLRALHLADDKPFLYEDRWVNLAMVPQILDVDFGLISANEWLVRNIPLTTGDITFSAANASPDEADILRTTKGAGIFIVDRTTWAGPEPITSVHLAYAPGFQMRTTI